MDDGEMPGTKPNPGSQATQSPCLLFTFWWFGDKVGEWSLFLHCINSDEGDMLNIGGHGEDDGCSDDNSASTTRFSLTYYLT